MRESREDGGYGGGKDLALAPILLVSSVAVTVIMVVAGLRLRRVAAGRPPSRWAGTAASHRIYQRFRLVGVVEGLGIGIVVFVCVRLGRPELYGEIRKQGYSHSQATVNRLLSNLRYTESQGKRLSHVPRAKKESIAGSSPTAKNVAALFMRREERLSEGQRGYLERLCASDAALADARRLTQDFAKMARELEGGKLDEWLEEADGCEASVMRRFSASLKRDLSAVRSGLTEQSNNGPVEGFVHKLKLVKRQGYGRAGFELLRARMLAA